MPKKNEITLSRLASALPDQMALILCSTTSRFGDLDTGLPQFLQFPAAASLIPKAGYSDLVERHMKWVKKFDAQINPGKNTSEEMLKVHWLAAHNSALFSDGMRH